MTSPDEALRLALDELQRLAMVQAGQASWQAIERHMPTLRAAQAALSTRSCSECAEFKSLQAELQNANAFMVERNVAGDYVRWLKDYEAAIRRIATAEKESE
jgi:hypothetical protein